MNREGKLVLIAGLLTIALTAGALTRIRSAQKLGEPGVRVVAQNIYREDGALVDTNSVPLPENLLDCHSRVIPLTTNELNWLPPDTIYGRRLYMGADGFGMQLSVVLMGRDRTSIHKPEYCLPGQGAKIVTTTSLTIPVLEPHPYALPVTRFTISQEVEGKRQQRQGFYVYWFVADGHITADHNERMLLMTKDLLTKSTLQRWAYISCFSYFPPGQEEATYARMSQLIAAAVPQFQLAAGSSAASESRR
ncbi:MAG: hypothetical protein QOF48_1962 [Verrucomicrobiota bacterium]|jgi:hypothetical protein